MRTLMAAVAVVALAIPAQAALAATPAKVTVSLKEFKLTPSATSVRAGTVTFTVKNVGKLDHELIVVKTNAAPGKLPVKNSKASEKGRVGGIAPLDPGKSGKLTLKLAKGKYVLLCNVTAHYPAGQYAGFTVK